MNQDSLWASAAGAQVGDSVRRNTNSLIPKIFFTVCKSQIFHFVLRES